MKILRKKIKLFTSIELDNLFSFIDFVYRIIFVFINFKIFFDLIFSLCKVKSLSLSFSLLITKMYRLVGFFPFHFISFFFAFILLLISLHSFINVYLYVFQHTGEKYHFDTHTCTWWCQIFNNDTVYTTNIFQFVVSFLLIFLL